VADHTGHLDALLVTSKNGHLGSGSRPAREVYYRSLQSRILNNE